MREYLLDKGALARNPLLWQLHKHEKMARRLILHADRHVHRFELRLILNNLRSILDD